MAIQQNIRVAVDAVVFGYHREQGLQVLLIERKNSPKGWALPGGFVINDESLDDAVQRELKEESGVKVSHLEQLYSFGAPDRDPRFRVVSVAYFALVRPEGLKLKAGSDAANAKWVKMKDIPELAFDHKEIIKAAHQRIKAKLLYSTLAFDLLDEKFRFSDLEKLYAEILKREIDRRNFRKKVLSYGVIDQLNERVKHKGSGRPAALFKFSKRKGKKLMDKGVFFEV